MTPTIKKLLLDVYSSIKAIDIHLQGERNFFNFQKNLTQKRTFERELEIIGETINKILKEDSEFKIENARKIVDLRNFIIHTYDAIDDELIWSIISRHIPKLESEIIILLNS
jgi:uncharacterized protein with HEPN domain